MDLQDTPFIDMYGHRIKIYAHGIIDKTDRKELRVYLEDARGRVWNHSDIRMQMQRRVADYVNAIIRPAVPWMITIGIGMGGRIGIDIITDRGKKMTENSYDISSKSFDTELFHHAIKARQLSAHRLYEATQPDRIGYRGIYQPPRPEPVGLIHPAKLVFIANDLVGKKLLGKTDIQITEGAPHFKGAQRKRSKINLKIKMPHIMAEGLAGQPLNSLIELPPVLHPFQHEQWEAITIEKARADKTSIKLTLSPIRQIIGIPPPCDEPALARWRTLASLAEIF